MPTSAGAAAPKPATPAVSAAPFSDVTAKRAPTVDHLKGSTPARSSGDIEGQGLAETIDAKSSFRLAEDALQRNDMATAEVHAKKALAADPTQSDYIALNAWIRALGGGPMEEAIRAMSKVLIEDPSNERALFYRGKLLVKTNRFRQALNDFNELLSANPSHQEAQDEVRQLESKVSDE